MVIKVIITFLFIFFIGLSIDYVFIILDEKQYIQFGSFLHILANGMLVFFPLSFFNKKSFFICFFVLVISSLLVFIPIVIIKNSYWILLSILVYTVFAFYIACKKLNHIGEK